MGVLDQITGLASRFSPSNAFKPGVMSGGIGHGHGMVSDDNMIVSKPAIVFHTSQIFFNFLAMACYASAASFQAKWKVGPSGLSGFAIFISIAGMFLSTFMLMVPVIYEKYDKFVRLARALKEVRVGFILTGIGTTASVLISFIVTISAWTQPGCKNPDNDPHKDLGDDFKKGLDGFCSSKKAAAIFFWLAFGFWLASLILLILDWRSGKLHAPAPPRDPPFTRPEMTQDLEDGLAEEEEEDDDYTHVPRPTQSSAYASSAHSPAASGRYDPSAPAAAASPFGDEHRYNPPPSSGANANAYGGVPAAGRPSMDAYGAFSDPAPSGFAPPQEPPRMSRTMQYADPYAAVRASIAGGGGSPSVASPQGVPPSYESYQGYR